MWSRILKVVDWFSDLSERQRVVRNFNLAAREAFVKGYAPTLLEAKTTYGDSSFRHDFSRFMAGGFRIKALSGRALERSEMVEIGNVVLQNSELVRKLISLGWDTLEVHDNTGYNGLKWQLMKYGNMGGYLS
ncbi:MAG: hypothetical protein ACK49D_10145 [Flavobacteriia bacterium]|jgi:hypothetical protein|nr:hypothetical protein [Cryomorphaceae bacterium]